VAIDIYSAAWLTSAYNPPAHPLPWSIDLLHSGHGQNLKKLGIGDETLYQHEIMAQNQYDVFISYRWIEPDQTWVRQSLYPALKAAGLNPILDVMDFLPGRDVFQEMERAGKSSDHVLCVISEAYLEEARMARFEVQMARRSDPGGELSRLIPLILRQTTLPEILRGLIAVDWTAPETIEQEWKKLLITLDAPSLDVKPLPVCQSLAPSIRDHAELSSSGAQILDDAKKRFHQLAIAAHRGLALAKAATKPEFFTAYSELFFRFLSESDRLKWRSHLFEDISGHIESTAWACPLLIQGPMGIGKSRFLFLLYLFLEARHASGTTPRWPIYIDLHRYDDLASSGDPKAIPEMKSRLVNDFRSITQVAPRDTEGPVKGSVNKS